MDEITVIIDMKKADYKKSYRYLKMYTHFRTGQNIFSALAIPIFFILGCKNTAPTINSFHNQNWFFFAFGILCYIIYFGISFVALSSFFQPSLYKDYFASQKVDLLHYEISFRPDSVLIRPYKANESEYIMIEYPNCRVIFNCFAGIAIFAYGINGIDRKYFFANSLFTNEEKAILKTWQQDYLFPITHHRIGSSK